jgi:NADH-quinone oxidoreductase subunit C
MTAEINEKAEAAIALAKAIATSLFWKLETEEPEPFRLDIKGVPVAELLNVVTAMRVQRLGSLAAITGLDPGPDSAEFEVLYHFCAGKAVITLRVPVPRAEPELPSLSAVIPVAESFERELQEMFGITVSGLSGPEHLYLPDDWPAGAYPLRKDFNRSLVRSNGQGGI